MVLEKLSDSQESPVCPSVMDYNSTNTGDVHISRFKVRNLVANQEMHVLKCWVQHGQPVARAHGAGTVQAQTV